MLKDGRIEGEEDSGGDFLGEREGDSSSKVLQRLGIPIKISMVLNEEP